MEPTPSFDYGERVTINRRTYQIEPDSTGVCVSDDGLVSYYGREVKDDGTLGQKISLWWLDEYLDEL